MVLACQIKGKIQGKTYQTVLQKLWKYTIWTTLGRVNFNGFCMPNKWLYIGQDYQMKSYKMIQPFEGRYSDGLSLFKNTKTEDFAYPRKGMNAFVVKEVL